MFGCGPIFDSFEHDVHSRIYFERYGTAASGLHLLLVDGNPRSEQGKFAMLYSSMISGRL